MWCCRHDGDGGGGGRGSGGDDDGEGGGDGGGGDGNDVDDDDENDDKSINYYCKPYKERQYCKHFQMTSMPTSSRWGLLLTLLTAHQGLLLVQVSLSSLSLSNNNNNNNKKKKKKKKKKKNRIVLIEFFFFFFFYNLLTAPRTVSNTYAQVAWAQSCGNHVQHTKGSSRASVMLRAIWYEGTAQLLSLTELKSHLF